MATKKTGATKTRTEQRGKRAGGAPGASPDLAGPVVFPTIPSVKPRDLGDDGIDPTEAARWDASQLAGKGSVQAGRSTAGFSTEMARVLRRALRLKMPRSISVSDRLEGVSRYTSAVAQAEIPLVLPKSRRNAPVVTAHVPERILLRHDDTFAHWLASRVRALGLSAGALGPNAEALTNVVFQPLQNAMRYGFAEVEGREDVRAAPEMVMSIVTVTGSLLRSYQAYRAALSKRGVHSARFLEVIIADTGPGIARHYFLATRDPSVQPNLLDQDFRREWLMLVQAFERHNSSRRGFLKASVNSDIYSPGIGLYAMLAGLRMLGAFFEVRTGRARLFRYAFPDEQLDLAAPLLWPARVSPELDMVRGTIIRFLIPLHSEFTEGQD